MNTKSFNPEVDHELSNDGYLRMRLAVHTVMYIIDHFVTVVAIALGIMLLLYDGKTYRIILLAMPKA